MKNNKNLMLIDLIVKINKIELIRFIYKYNIFLKYKK
jgi:hypothetical protein